MGRLVLLFAEMLRLRTSPQQIPASSAVVWLSMLALVAVSLLVSHRLYPPDIAAGRVGLDLVLQVLFFAGVLQWAGHPERFRQAFAAACGTSTLLVLLAWPLLDIVAERGEGDPLFSLATVMLLGINIWLVVVFGHILRHALELRLRRCIALALAFVLLSVLIGNAVFPSPEMAAH